MGIFDFLKKKKEEDLGDLNVDLGPEPAFPGGEMPGMPGAPGGVGGMPGAGRGFGAGAPQLFGEQAQPPPPPAMMPMPSPTTMQMAQPGGGFGQQNYGMPGGDVLSSRVEILSTKLDSLRASIDRINEKLDYIERLLSGGRRYV